MDMTDGLEERVARLEARFDGLKDDIEQLRLKAKENADRIESVHGRINDLMKNEIAHLKHGRDFWVKVVIAAISGGGIGVTLIECFFKYLLPKLLGG